MREIFTIMPPPGPPASASLPAAPEDLLFRNVDTGASVSLASARLLRRPRALARALAAGDVQSAWAPSPDAVVVDAAARTYRFKAYPPLRLFLEQALGALLPALRAAPLHSPLGLAAAALALLAGALFIAGCAQVSFLFPCLSLSGYVQYDVGGASYCVPSGRLAQAQAAGCVGAAVADVCAARIPVTMQTYAVMLLGAVGGHAGALATALYVLMVCLGAPFQAGAALTGQGLAMWNKGAIIGSSGGFLWGFIAASAIMGRAVERGTGRGASVRSALWLIPYIVGAELAIYACGLFWLPFGMAIRRNVSPAAICPEAQGASQCLYNIFNWGMVPFLPGECFKMALILATVPAAWSLLLALHSWRSGMAPVPSEAAAEGEGEEEEEEEGEEQKVTVVAAAAAGEGEVREPAAAQ